MPFDLSKVPARNEEGSVHVVVESPQGSRVKLKYEPSMGAICFSRPLVLGLAYPFDWGFVPSTRAADGDPLDAMILFDQPTFPGVVVPCRCLAVVRLEQNRKDRPGRQRNDRLIMVPAKAPRLGNLRGPGDLSKRLRMELEQFFLSATFFEQKDPKLLGWGHARAAEKLVDDLEKR